MIEVPEADWARFTVTHLPGLRRKARVRSLSGELDLPDAVPLAELGHNANKPLVVRLDGNNVEEGRRILAEANHPLVTLAATMDEGADKAAELANAAK